jgi:lipopolysaccharide export system permease protein
MIIARYLSKQIMQVTAAITFLLLAVVVLIRLLKYLTQASQGELDSGVLLLLMSYRMPEFLQLILPLAMLLGILLAYGRMYAENEMTVLLACGFSKKKLLAVTLISATAVGLVVGALSMKVTPWGLVHSATLLEAQKELNEFDVMVPGIFQDISRGARTTYSENIAEDVLQNVFMFENANNRVTVSETAQLRDDERGRIVLFKDGSLTQGVSGDQDYSLTDFTEFGIRIPQREINIEITVQEKAMSTTALLASSEASHVAELQWRISLILLIPILALLAVALSKVNPRQGRFARLAPAILIYIFYFGLLLGSRDLISEGELSPVIGMWWVHVLFTIFGLLLFLEKIPHLAELGFWKTNANA